MISLSLSPTSLWACICVWWWVSPGKSVLLPALEKHPGIKEPHHGCIPPLLPTYNTLKRIHTPGCCTLPVSLSHTHTHTHSAASRGPLTSRRTVFEYSRPVSRDKSKFLSPLLYILNSSSFFSSPFSFVMSSRSLFLLPLLFSCFARLCARNADTLVESFRKLNEVGGEERGLQNTETVDNTQGNKESILKYIVICPLD